MNPILPPPGLLLAISAALAPAPATTAPEDVAVMVGAAHTAAREGRLSDARRGYLEAASRAPDIRDWLLLRAAGVTAEAESRAALYGQVRLAAVRARLVLTEAAARERTGDWAGAAAHFDSAGREADAFRARLRAAGAAERAELRGRLLARAGEEPDPARGRALVEVFLQTFPSPPPREALTLARATRDPARRAELYRRAIAAGHASPEDRLAYARALADLRRHREAVAAFDRVAGPSALRAEARFRAARSRLRLGDRAGAKLALWQVVERFPAERETVARALLLAGELARDAGDSAEARRIWLDLAAQHPAGSATPRARFLAALTAYEQGSMAAAAREWTALRSDFPTAEPSPAAGYWAGRAWLRVGAVSRAEDAWRGVLERDTLSYYAVLSARRLGVAGWSPRATPAPDAAHPDVDSVMTRMALLRSVGMSPEIEWERDHLVAGAAFAPERLVAIAEGLRKEDQSAAAIRVARQALAVGAATDARLYRLLYPVAHRDALARLAGETGVDPAVAAALIRQESGWEPKATSAAGARGLMQVMPATGALLAGRLGLVPWHTDRLYEPETNLRLGVAYLADVLRRHEGDTVRALAAYNAGPGAVARWSAGRPTEDPELFVERIPFTETRDYVRIVIRNLALYRALYPPPA